LQQGESVFIFPEGTFTKEDGIRPFQLGAFKAAVSAGLPIIPVSLAGSRKFLRDGTYIPRPTNVTITLSSPIYPRGAAAPVGGATVQAGATNDPADWHDLIRLRDETRNAIAQHAGEPLL
jgi:hypothetical protein